MMNPSGIGCIISYLNMLQVKDYDHGFLNRLEKNELSSLKRNLAENVVNRIIKR